MKVTEKQLEVFGYGLAAIMVIFALRFVFKKDASGFVIFILALLSGLLSIITFFRLNWMRPLYDIWMKGARIIGLVVMTVILSILFFLVFGLVGIILRILRKDLLQERWDTEKSTYWHPRPKQPFDKNRYLQQF